MYHVTLYFKKDINKYTESELYNWGDYNSQPSSKIHTKLKMADHFRECSAI